MRITLIVLAIALLFAARTIASYVIEVEWWKELGQFDTWLSMLTYSFAPLAAATLLAFAMLWITHARALKFAGTSLGDHGLYASLRRWACSFSATSSRPPPSITGLWCASPARAACRPPRPARRCGVSKAALLLSLRSALLRPAARLRAGARDRRDSALLDRRARAGNCAIASTSCAACMSSTHRSCGSKAAWNRASCAAPAVVLLLAFGVKFLSGALRDGLQRARQFLVGVDWVDQNVGIPLQWLLIFACVAAAVLVWMGRFLWAAFLARRVGRRLSSCPAWFPRSM